MTSNEPGSSDTDRDLATLQAAEQELADLERDLSRLEGSDDAPLG